MIKVERNFTPIFFTPAHVNHLTNVYRNNKNNHVWQHGDVKAACLELSNRKCVYCEVVLNQKSTYLEIDHFKHKDLYPNDVIQWDNLLPSCRHCNGTKGDHDVGPEPIINPAIDNPANHLFLKAYRLKGSDAIGAMTVEVLNLNDSQHFVTERCKVGTFIAEQIDIACDKFANYQASPNSARKRELVKVIKALLNECQNNALFSAVSSATLHDSEEYILLRDNMIANQIWATKFEELHLLSLAIRLPSVK